MSQITRSCAIVFIVISLVCANGGNVAAQGDVSSQYFADTGHTISGEFWTYYQSISNAGFVFGSPITEQFVDAQTGRMLQYFQRARFEFYPENPAGQRVKLSSAGEYAYQRTAPGTTVDSFTPIGCRFYPETNFSLCYAFLEFFDKNGGEAIFGKPISPFVFYNGRIVQYFERARFEWYPEYPEGQKVVLAELGRVYFDLAAEDANRLQSVQPANNIQGDVMTLHAKVFTWKAVTQLTDQQSVYVVVQDQKSSPIEGATAIVTITWPQGGTQSMAQTSNAQGVVIVPLQVQGQPHGSMVQVDVEVLYQDLSNRAQTSFRSW